MASKHYAVPEFQRGEVDRAGKKLVCAQDGPQDLMVVGNWRSAHSFPLNSLHVTLRGRARKIDPAAVTAQRLKRLSSIEAKLRRFQNMQLSQMQDIGGCRAVVRTTAMVRLLVIRYKRAAAKNPTKRPQLVKEYDYVLHPKPDGYRGVHMVFKYRSPSKAHAVYNDLRIEIQIRSQLQHAWATAVETVGTFIQQALKSNQGEAEWLRFFALMGSYIAMRERTPLVPGTPTDRLELRRELRRYAEQLEVVEHLELYATALGTPERAGAASDAHYFLLELDPTLKRIRVTGYKADELEKAASDYLTVETNLLAQSEFRDAVLVSVKSFAALKQAYPNYFLDTHRFIRIVREAVKVSMVENPSQGRLFH
jgi:hypothetical protein